MPSGRSIWVPLRSNAHSLVSGAPASAFRRRLKLASITYDQILLEGGGLVITAGPDGSVEAPMPKDHCLKLQAGRNRHLAAGQRFTFSIGEEALPGVPATELTNFINSETSIVWAPTLAPFIQEIGDANGDWAEVVVAQKSSAVSRTADMWKRRDNSNPAVVKAFPELFVRHKVVGHVARDLSLAAHEGVAVMQDTLHSRVFAARSSDDPGWVNRGFALPILVPHVAELDWATIADLRRHPRMKDFRRILAELEMELLEETSAGNLETAVHRAMRTHVAKAVGQVEGLGSIPKHAMVDLGVGTVGGLATAGLAGPVAIAAGAAGGAAITAVRTASSVIKARKKRGWVSVLNLLDAEAKRST